jgi:hypothetical protein
MELTSPVIQVVTTGTDWPAIVAAISGGVVGPAGIAFGARQASHSISAEDKRARLTEKCRIYANCLSMLELGSDAAFKVREHGDTPQSDEHRNAVQEFDRAKRIFMSAIREVDLIAPIEVAGPADKASLFIAQIPRDVAWAKTSRVTEA